MAPVGGRTIPDYPALGFVGHSRCEANNPPRRRHAASLALWVPETLTAPVPENLAAFRNGAMDDPVPQFFS
jgi:hypothetical protein